MRTKTSSTNKSYLWIALLSLFLIECSKKTTLPAKTKPQQGTSIAVYSPKREFRGVWVATVQNIDWPSRSGLNAEVQQKEFSDLLDFNQKQGFNAVLVQVRASADAFYARSKEPWSEYLSGTQGKSPEPYYDPMRFMIEEAHQRNLEFHAWLNLNRGVHKSAKTIDPNHVSKKNPGWFINYGGYKLFDFGLPEVREYIVEVVVNIVKHYDVDGIHFDDYFYPYTIAGESLKDQNTFKKYGKGFKNIEDWRRHNIDLLIKDVSVAIRAEKNWVKFGISPFGVWRNKKIDPTGSDTEAGQTSYDNLYADTRKWAGNGWIDYIAPQIYFAFEHPKVPFKPLLDWWSDNSSRCLLYVGHAAYKVDVNSKEKGFDKPEQLLRQIKYVREKSEVSGSIFYNASAVRKNTMGFADTIKQAYKYPALQPLMSWKDGVPPDAPTNLSVSKSKNIGAVLAWKEPNPKSKQNKDLTAYIVYRFKENEVINLENPANIVKIIRNAGMLSFTDSDIDFDSSYIYIVTAIDRFNNESMGSNHFILNK